MRYRVILILLAVLPIAAAAVTNPPTLYFGMRNEAAVARLQGFLTTRGYYRGPADGNYSLTLVRAIKNFQLDYGLPAVGGYAGPATQRLIATLTTAPAALPPESEPQPSPPSVPRSTARYSRGPQLVPPPPASPVVLDPNASPYQDKITISSFSGRSTDPGFESLTLTNRTRNETITVTGFQIINSRNSSFTIPKGHAVPGLYPTAEDLIVLKPGMKAVISAGRQEKRMDFLENVCTGYFTESSRFVPSLSTRCPRLDPGEDTDFSDACLRSIRSVPTCREANVAGMFDAKCANYLSQHGNYAGCVRDFRAHPDFFLGRWLIWMQRDQEFFRNVRERVTLKDQQGKVVDEKSY